MKFYCPQWSDGDLGQSIIQMDKQDYKLMETTGNIRKYKIHEFLW